MDVILQLVVFAGSAALGLVWGLLVHELGHGLAAVLFTKQRVVVQVGAGRDPATFALGRLEIRFSRTGLRYGWTEYKRSLAGRGTQIVVALCGPLATIALIALTASVIVSYASMSLPWLAGLGLLVANFRILATSLLPVRLRNPDNPSEVWLSDSLDIWELIKR